MFIAKTLIRKFHPKGRKQQLRNKQRKRELRPECNKNREAWIERSDRSSSPSPASAPRKHASNANNNLYGGSAARGAGGEGYSDVPGGRQLLGSRHRLSATPALLPSFPPSRRSNASSFLSLSLFPPYLSSAAGKASLPPFGGAAPRMRPAM